MEQPPLQVNHPVYRVLREHIQWEVFFVPVNLVHFQKKERRCVLLVMLGLSVIRTRRNVHSAHRVNFQVRVLLHALYALLDIFQVQVPHLVLPVHLEPTWLKGACCVHLVSLAYFLLQPVLMLVRHVHQERHPMLVLKNVLPVLRVMLVLVVCLKKCARQAHTHQRAVRLHVKNAQQVCFAQVHSMEDTLVSKTTTVLPVLHSLYHVPLKHRCRCQDQQPVRNERANRLKFFLNLSQIYKRSSCGG